LFTLLLILFTADATPGYFEDKKAQY